jgi:hypothetical protein
MPRQYGKCRAIDDPARYEAWPDSSFPDLVQQRSQNRRQAHRKHRPAHCLFQDDHSPHIPDYLFLR